MYSSFEPKLYHRKALGQCSWILTSRRIRYTYNPSAVGARCLMSRSKRLQTSLNETKVESRMIQNQPTSKEMMLYTSSCPMKIGSLVVYKHLVYKERRWSRTEVRRRSGSKFGTQIVTEHPWGPARTPPCAPFENLHADFNCKSDFWALEHRIHYRTTVETRS